MRNLKRALSLALALVMVMSMMVVGAGAVSIDDFTDADEIVNTEAVTTMVSLGVIDGNDDGSYNPSGIVKRGEMAKLIAVMLNGGSDPTLGETPVVFADTAGHWAQNYISYVANLHIIDGRGDGTFGPNDDVTGSEAAKMLLTALGYRSDLEGFTGANWAINVQAMANQIELFDGLTINPDEGLTRDNTAQMLYNAVQADMVEYRNLEGSYDGIVYPQPINGVNNDSTVLYERFHVRKVTGILEANDKVSVAGAFGDDASFRAGHEAGSVALEGESLLYVTDVSGYTYDRTWNVSTNYANNLYGAATYKVDTSDDMVGQEIVIYVRYLNDLSPNAANATVIGTPILTENNTVVETTGRLKDEAAVRSALRAGGLTNIGTGSNAPAAFLYTEEYVDGANGVASGITDAIAAQLRGTDVNGDGSADNTRSAGIQQRFIDNDGNGYPDYIIQVAPVLSSVNSVNTARDTFTFTGITGSISDADIVTEETLERNDVILVNQYADGKYYITYPETVEGTVESYNTNDNTVSVDGTSYANSGGKKLNVSGTDQILIEEIVDNTYIFYLDNYGNVLGYIETDASVGNYAVVRGYSLSGNERMGYSAQVRLLMQDGSLGSYDLNLAATAVRLGLAAGNASTSDKENALVNAFYLGDAADPTEGTLLVDHLFSYTLDGDTVTLARPYHVNDDRWTSTYTVDADNDGSIDPDPVNGELNTTADLAAAETELQRNDARYNLVNGDEIVANDQTVIFIKDVDGDYFVVTGLANLPSAGVQLGATVSGTNTRDTISYTAPGSNTQLARAIFVTTNEQFEAAREFVFVTNRYTHHTSSGTPVYTFDVVYANGDVGQMTTTDNANDLENTVREYTMDGSYVDFYAPDAYSANDKTYTIDNVYVADITGNTITLNDIDTNEEIGSFRLDGGADIWDVQDETPVSDGLAENDMVAVKRDTDGVIIAAFIYDVMNGAYPNEPSSITLNGAALGGTLTLTSLDAQDLALSVTLDRDTAIDSLSVTRRNAAGVTQDTKTVRMTEGTGANIDIWTGTYSMSAAAAGDTLEITMVLTQPGMDNLTVVYNVTLAMAASGDPTGVVATAEANLDATVGGTVATVEVTGGANYGYTWYYYETANGAASATAIVSGQGGFTVAANGALSVDTTALTNGTDYTFYCDVVSDVGTPNETETPVRSNSVTLTPNAYSEEGLTLNLNTADDWDPDTTSFTFYADRAPLTVSDVTDPVNGRSVTLTIPAGTTELLIQNASWNAGDSYTFNNAEYVVTAGNSIQVPVSALSDGMEISAADFVRTRAAAVSDPTDFTDINAATENGVAVTIEGTVPAGTINGQYLYEGGNPFLAADVTLSNATVEGSTLINGGVTVDGTLTIGSAADFEAVQVDVPSGSTLSIVGGSTLNLTVLQVYAGGTIDYMGLVVTANADLYIDLSAGTINGEALFTPGDGMIAALTAANDAGYFA